MSNRFLDWEKSVGNWLRTQTEFEAKSGYAETLTSTGNWGTAVPDDVYSSILLDQLYETRSLAGVALMGGDLSGQAGSTVKVPYLSGVSAPSATSEGDAVASVQPAINFATVTLDKYMVHFELTRELLEDQMLVDQGQFLRWQAQAIAERQDIDVFTELNGATPGQSQTLATAGDLADVYDQIVELKADLRGAKYAPDSVIIHPDVEAQLLKDTSEGVKFGQLNVQNGEVLSIAGMRAYVTPHANANAATSNLVQAVVLDSSRAIAEAWGRRPMTIVDEFTKADEDEVRLITSIRWGVDEVDTGAIGHVTN